jgi:tetratricopeptide (TPR) repeat protein
MPETSFAELETLHRTAGAAAAIERLIESLRASRDYRRLFDALLLKKRHQMGLPLAQPTSLDVPEEKREEFEQAFIAAAREIGELFLQQGQIPQAWGFLNMIREPEKVRQAIERLDPRSDSGEPMDAVLQIALYEGAHPVKGLELLLHSHGTCNTITAMDQVAPQMKPEDRKRAAALLVREIYDDLRETLNRDVQSRMAGSPPADSIRELIAGRDFLFADGNYHIDVSHLNSVVRFARFLDGDNPELHKAIELAEYGSRLSPQLQYPGDAPFDDFYPAHVQFLKALAGEDVDEALAYFRQKLDAEPDEQDRLMIAYVLVDLLVRLNRLDEAVEIAERHLAHLDESSGFSLAQLCQEAGRMDVLQRVSCEKGDLVKYTAALLQGPIAERGRTSRSLG